MTTHLLCNHTPQTCLLRLLLGWWLRALSRVSFQELTFLLKATFFMPGSPHPGTGQCQGMAPLFTLKGSPRS